MKYTGLWEVIGTNENGESEANDIKSLYSFLRKAISLYSRTGQIGNWAIYCGDVCVKHGTTRRKS